MKELRALHRMVSSSGNEQRAIAPLFKYPCFEQIGMVEAGGVEPPSEKPCNAKTTCLARSDFFVASAQSGQDARATSPMISPPHYGPKRGNQPTV